MESQSQSTTTTLPQWTEIVEDLWDLLPHFQQWYDEDCQIVEDLWDLLPHFQQWYDEDCLKFDCVKLQFADGEESDNDDEIWLEQTACEKESPATIEETKQVSQSKLKLHIYAHQHHHIPVYFSLHCVSRCYQNGAEHSITLTYVTLSKIRAMGAAKYDSYYYSFCSKQLGSVAFDILYSSSVLVGNNEI